MSAADAIDGILESSVVGSFTKLGSFARSRLDDWTPIEDYDLTGRTVVLTGATSGLGLAAARILVRQGASLIPLGRDESKLSKVCDDLQSVRSGAEVHPVVGDMGEFEDVRRVAAEITAKFPEIDTVVHNAGALLAERRTNATGIEVTVASQVLGPFLMTSLLLDALSAGDTGRVLTMASGGMYTAPLTVEGIEMSGSEYAGSRQYALAKRAQVTLNELWAAAVVRSEIVFHALHPGWADTPGVSASLPTFRKIVGPMLRDPDDGADTLVWLAADDEALDSSGDFWLDRRRRPIHRSGKTKASDTAMVRSRLWDWCVDATGIDPLAPL